MTLAKTPSSLGSPNTGLFPAFSILFLPDTIRKAFLTASSMAKDSLDGEQHILSATADTHNLGRRKEMKNT